MTQERKPLPILESAEQIHLPVFNSKEANKTFMETGWIKLSNGFLGELVLPEDKKGEAFVFLFDFKNKITTYLPWRFKEADYDLINWGDKGCALVSITRQLIAIFDLNDPHHIKLKHIVRFKKNQLNSSDTFEAFPDGEHFVINKEYGNFILMNVTNTMQKKIESQGFSAKLHLLRNNRLLITSEITANFHWETSVFPIGNHYDSYKLAHLYDLDFHQPNWISKTEGSVSWVNTDRVYCSSTTPICVQENFPRLHVSQLTIRNLTTDKVLRTIVRDFSQSDGTIRTYLAPNGFVFFTTPNYHWSLYDPFSDKEYELNLNYRGRILLFFDDQTFGTLSNNSIQVFRLCDPRLEMTATNELKKLGIPKGPMKLINEYAFSFFQEKNKWEVDLESFSEDLEKSIAELNSQLENKKTADMSLEEKEKLKNLHQAIIDKNAINLFLFLMATQSSEKSYHSFVERVTQSFPEINAKLKNHIVKSLELNPFAFESKGDEKAEFTRKTPLSRG